MDFNAEPFYDDFEASNGAHDQNYMRILFRPGYAVQARELTQIQSIIQNQLKSFGDHIFKDGSPVYGGHITLDTSVNYIKLESSYNGVDIDLEDFQDRIVFNSAGTARIRAKVSAIDDTQTSPTLMIRYLRGTQFPNSNVITTSSGSFAQLIPSAASGIGSTASIAEGIFYVDGYFIKVEPQTIVLDAYNSIPTYKIGLEIDDEIIDESADANLLDPAQNSFNYQAPGAHRYKFALNLAKRSLDSVDDQRFFELLRVENGVITKQVVYPIYSEIEKTLARRTADESGDYVVSPFGVSVSANVDSDNTFIVNMEAGKAYVKGFEFESVGTQKLTIDKARTSNVSTDYDLSVEYGNYVYSNNIIGSANGLFDITKLDKLELHCVPRANINTVGSLGYTTSYMGSARVLNFDRDSSSEYLLYLTDIKLESNTVTAASTGTANTVVFPASYSNLNNAYANVSMRVLSGDSAGDVRKIISYNGTTKTATMDLNFTGLVGSGNTVALLYDVKDIDSIVEVVSTKTAFNVAMDISSSSKDITGGTILYDSRKNSLLFRLPEDYIANNTIDNADFIHRKFFESKTFSANGQLTLTLSGNETFPYGSDGAFLSTTTSNDNLIIMVSANSAGSNVAVGSIINLNGPLGGVRRDSSTQLTIYTGANTTFTGDVYATVKVNDSEQATNNRRSKTIKGNSAITALRSTDAHTNGVAVTGDSTVKIDTANGFVWFTDYNNINKTPGGNNSLYVSDVYKIVKIFDSGSSSYAPNTVNATDITSRFYLDSGQTLSYYDHSKLVLKPGVISPKGQLVAMVQYYEHSSAINGYFDVDSYPSSQYANGTIPVFVTSDGSQYNLRDCVDFRPTRDIGTSSTVASYTFVGMKNPKPYEPMELTYSYYVPRIDKIVLTKDKELKVVKGVASKVPEEPVDSTESMVIFKLDIPPYTANPTDVKITSVENKRYTMKDIGVLEKRIKNLEYYTALSLSEKTATDKNILYEDNATQKEKYGIIVDNFTSFSVADYKSPDFISAIDSGGLLPYNDVTHIPLILNFISQNVKVNDKTITLPFTEEVVIEQTSATSNVSIQPYLYGKFDGNMRLIPQSDSWFSIQLEPNVVSPIQAVANTDTTVIVSGLQPATGSADQSSGLYGSTPSTVYDWYWYYY